MTNDDIGYTENPQNGFGIKRSRTTKQIRAWSFGRSLKALHALNEEMGNIEYPGVYILFESDKKVYVGEAKNVVKRLDIHHKTPEDKISKWDQVIIIGDGRPASQSDFNDEVVRKSLELYLINLFKTNKYIVVAQGEIQTLNPLQKHLVDSLKKELLFFLKKTTLITKDVENREEREVFSDEIKTILGKSKKTINSWKEKEAVIDGEITFIRPGSRKIKGYQITIRGGKAGSFIDCLKNKTGNLLIPRDGVLLIPLSIIHDIINDKLALKRDTVDIWVIFKDEKAYINYKTNTIDVTKYRLVN